MPPQLSRRLYTPLSERGSTKPFSGSLDDIMKGIAHVESGGDYSAIGKPNSKGQRAYGKYQVFETNIPSWTKEALGREYSNDEFLADQDAQEQVARHFMQQSLDKYGNADDVASVWFTGRPRAEAGNVADYTGTTNDAYLKKFKEGMGGLSQEIGNQLRMYRPIAQRSPTDLPKTHAEAEPQLSPFFKDAATFGREALRPLTDPSTIITPSLESIGVPTALAVGAGIAGDFLTPFPGRKVKAGEEFAKSVLQIVHKDGTQSFLRIPKEQFEQFKTLVDDGQEGMSGIPTKNGDVFHLTAKAPEQMAERGFKDLGVADVANLPQRVAEHTRLDTGVKEYLRTKPIPTYKGEKDLSTKLLRDLEGRSTVSKQYLMDATNRADLKQPERDLFRRLLADEGDEIKVKDFANKVKSELLPLKSSTWGERYENINLPEELRGPVQRYGERMYESSIKTSAGDVHFGNREIPGYFAHSRYEDLPTSKGPNVFNEKTGQFAPSDTRRVIEIQSDLFQKGRLEAERNTKGFGRWDELDLRNRQERLAYLEKEARKSPQRAKELEDEIADTKIDIRLMSKDVDAIAERNKGLDKLEPYRNTWHERVIREEVKQAAIDGKTKLQFPTGETAMKIEGLGERADWWWPMTRDESGALSGGRRLKANELEVGKEVQQGQNQSWIITDVLGDGKFKAIPKDRLLPNTAGRLSKEQGYAEVNGQLYIPSQAETFDISGKVDTNNPIYKFYEKEVGRYLTNKYGAKRIKDPQGVEWWEIPVTKEQAKLPIEAFAAFPLLTEQEE